jgi:hypothetical protein
MPEHIRNRMLQEAELASRFSEMYRRLFAELIARLNGNLQQPADRNGLRLCIEAVDMMLATQSYLTRAIIELSSTAEAHRRAA